jgi:hypothetical protein
MNSTRLFIAFAALAVITMGFYAFRPDRAFFDRVVAEPAPDDVTTVVARGAFRSLAHDGRGEAVLLRHADGRLTLRLADFATLDGPDVRIYLLGADSVSGRSALQAAGFVDLGPLKGNIGDQNYAIPAGTDLTRVRAVSVWCRRFGVNFTAAVLANEARTAD